MRTNRFSRHAKTHDSCFRWATQTCPDDQHEFWLCDSSRNYFCALRYRLTSTSSLQSWRRPAGQHSVTDKFVVYSSECSKRGWNDLRLSCYHHTNLSDDMWLKEQLHRTESFRRLCPSCHELDEASEAQFTMGPGQHDKGSLPRTGTTPQPDFCFHWLKFVLLWPDLIGVELRLVCISRYKPPAQRHDIVQDHGLEPSEGTRASNRAVLSWFLMSRQIAVPHCLVRSDFPCFFTRQGRAISFVYSPLFVKFHSWGPREGKTSVGFPSLVKPPDWEIATWLILPVAYACLKD